MDARPGRALRQIAAVLALMLLAGACGAEADEPPARSPIRRGGTLRLATPANPIASLGHPGAAYVLDPTLEYESIAWEVLRCCLTRTLMSYTGTPVQEGGGELRPDLASEEPEISGDGLTWTFHIRRGVRYAPPLQDVEIRAADFVRALERDASLGGAAYNYYYSAIEGFDAFAGGDAEAISGLETPDDHTLVIRLTRPSGDFGHRLALPATAPIPASPNDPSARFGVAVGHDDGYGRFLVSSGPYMIEGSDELDPSARPEDQRPVSGIEGGDHLVLVRNPSWSPDQDPLRVAYSDRIELTVAAGREEAFAEMEDGDADLVVWPGPPPQPPAELVDRYREDPGLGRVDIHPRDVMYPITMNLAAPPFDDVHVRRAMNLVLDKQAIIDRWGGGLGARVATHIGTDGIEGGLLAGYDPYPTPGSGGDPDAARQEMAKAKRYDRDGDGRCDAAVCRGLPAVEIFLPPPRAPIGNLVRGDLAEIGIDLKIERPADPFVEISDPAKRVALGITVGWAKDFVNASGFFFPLFRSSSLGRTDFSLLGASDEQLARWGYPVRGVPNVDARIDECVLQVGPPQTQCWATLDQYLMEEVVPFVPFAVDNDVVIVPKRVREYSFCQFTTLPALDRIAVED